MLRGLREFDPVIAELARNAERHFGFSPVHIAPLRRIDGRYSSVLNVRICARDRRSTAYIKVFRPRDGSPSELARVHRFLRREFRAASALHDAFADQDDVGALRPIACMPEHRAIVTEEVSGRPFGELLANPSSPAREIHDAARRIGRWVLAYQRAVPGHGDVLLAERRAYLDERLQMLESRILSPGERSDVLDRFDTLAAAIGWPSVPATAIHADLTPMNVLVGHDGRVTVLDFTMAKVGTALHDLAHMYFHVASFGARRRARRPLAAAVQTAILEGYDPTLSPDDPLFRLMLWQHAVCHIAMLTERRVPLGQTAYHWYLRRRWTQVSSLAAGAV